MRTIHQGLRFLRGATTEELNELGQLMAVIADMPEAARKRAIADALALHPEPQTGRVNTVEEARGRVAAEHASLWDEGWHPIQMRRVLEAAGYTGTFGEGDVPQRFTEDQWRQWRDGEGR